MSQLKMFISGALIVCLVTLVVTLINKNKPQKADKQIDYVMFSILTLLLIYSIMITDWLPVKEKLSEDIELYQEAQRNAWDW